MGKSAVTRPAWKKALSRKEPLLLPSAHDGLTARLIERAGFRAFQVGGFALVGARHGFPDIDLAQFGEQAAAVGDILEATGLPVLVDGDDGYGDAKNVTRTVRTYEAMGVSALFIEDQRAPKRCGHLSGKEVVPAEVMEEKVRAAVAARQDPDTFLIARTDALEPLGMDEALRRAERYLNAGADGVYVEAPKSVEDLERIGKAFQGVPQMTNMFEGDGETPWLTPKELRELGYSMILYPTSILFRVARAIERALDDLKAGRAMPLGDGVDLKTFEEMVGLPFWSEVETRFGKASEAG
jgi:2-methylisocitrate lyase-like PEP mutase family enzyme